MNKHINMNNVHSIIIYKNYTDSAVFLVYEKNILFLFKQDLFLCF